MQAKGQNISMAAAVYRMAYLGVHLAALCGIETPLNQEHVLSSHALDLRV